VSEATSKPSQGSDFEKERDAAFEAFRGALFSPAESLEITEKKEEQIDWDFENEKVSLENRKEKRKVRRHWNTVLMSLVIAGFILSYALIILIGLGAMNFSSTFAVPSVVAAGVLQTYGLAKLAIKYFFSEDGEESFKGKR